MSEHVHDSRQVAMRRYFQATTQVFDRLTSERNRGVSDSELRVSWQFSHSASQRMSRHSLQLWDATSDWPNLESDLSEVKDAICALAMNPLPEIVDYTEKLLARSFETRYGSGLALDYRQWSDDEFRVPFEGLSEPLLLADALAITHDWETTNQRRVELIEKEIEGTLSDDEEEELARLQKLAWAKRNISVPLPVRELALIRAAMARQREREEER